MLIPFFVIICFAAFLVLCGMLIGRTGREQLRRELAHVLGQLKQSNDKADKMTEIAGKALSVAQEKHFPVSRQPFRTETSKGTPIVNNPYIEGTFNYHADPDSFRVENCPECFVSVRASEWPQECPACHSVFGFDLT